MAETSSQTVAADRMARPLLVTWLIVGWFWAGIPLGAGVYFSVKKALPLFGINAPAAPGK